MRPAELDSYRLHARLSGYRRREDRLLRFLAEHIDDRTVVAFSAGKDSSVVAHAARRVRPDIPILMVDPGCPTHWIEAERAQWLAYAAAHDWRLYLFPWDKWAAVSGATDVKQHQRLAHAGMFRDLHAWMEAHGHDQTITGMRAQESRGRLMHRRIHGLAFQAKSGARWLMPIGDWRVEDVWAYLVAHDLPWLGIYDKAGPDGRNGILGRSGAAIGRAQQIHRHYPEHLALARELMPDIFGAH